MKHATPPTGRLIALVALASLACATSAAAQPTPTPTPNPIYECAGKIVGVSGLRDYTNNYLAASTVCALEDLDGTGCVEQDFLGEVENVDGELISREETKNGVEFGGVVSECDPGALDAICPLGADTFDEAYTALVGATPTSVKSRLQALVDDLFVTEYPEACPRPVGPVPDSECAGELVNVVVGQETIERVEQCFFSCERPRLAQSGLEVCVDDVTGDPIKDDVVECVADALQDLELLDDRCDAQAIEELGCPLGAESLTGLKNALGERITAFARELNLGIFHSPCQTNLPGGPSEPVPAEVTLEPSGTKKQVSCGQTIDGAFMGSDKTISFDTDLDCSGAQTGTDGIVIAKTNIKLNGRNKLRSIRGPQRSSLRTGAGIRLAAGASRVQIRNFKAIENFGVGIEDAVEGNNKKLVIVKTTVRRNIQAGLRLRSPRVKIDEVVADKNGIGMDLSGDGTKVKASQAKGSLYDPKVGLKLSGIDTNLNGTIVQVTGIANTIELNQGVGVWITEGGHVVSEAQILSNGGAGVLIEALGVGSNIDTNNVKSNGAGIVVLGNGNLVDSNTCEQNVGDGFVIGGTGNVLLNNDSGKKTDRGNGGNGFVISGLDVSVENNVAEANVGSGFVVTGTTTLFKGNGATVNQTHGFDIQSGGHVFDTCEAEANGPENDEDNLFHEWVIAPDCSAANDSNSAGGDRIGIPAAGGICDNDSDCPLLND